MASTYALPAAPASHVHSHGRSRSQYTPEPSPLSNEAMNGASPAREHGHGHSRSDLDGNGQLYGAVRSPYAEYSANAHEHSHGHERSGSNDSTHTLKPFSNGSIGRSKGRQRESDLARSSPKKTPVIGKYGFSPVSPIEEAPPHVHPPASSPPMSSSWLELPEALTALLIPLPYLFAALTYPGGTGQPAKLPSSLSEAVAESAPLSDPVNAINSTPLLHALALSSATLLLVGIVAKLNSTLQPLDRRKEAKATFNTHNAPKSIATNAASVLLPFYASLQLGGAKTALVLLIAVAAGIGALDKKPGKHTPWDDARRTLRTRKVTFGALFLAMTADIMTSGNTTTSLFGCGALLISMFLVPPPLPTAGRSIMTSQGSYMSQTSSRALLPKPSSPLINSAENQLFTIVSGLALLLVTMVYSFLSSSTVFSLSQHTLGFSTLSIASAAALVYFSLPASLRTQNQVGVKLSGILIFAFSFLEHGGHLNIAFPWFLITTFTSQRYQRTDTKQFRLNLAFMMVQFFYGFVSGSLGLLTDSIHMLFDCAGLAVGLAAAVMSKWRPNARFPYGYGKIDTLSGFANGVFLLLVSVEIIFDAFERLWEGHELQRLNELLIVSVLGFLVNIVGLTAFGHAHHGHGHDHGHDHGHGHGHSHDNENMQGIFLHILADALGSVAVIISTLLTKYYGWSGWDPIASCIIAILIFLSAIPLVKSSGARLMLSLPNDVEYGIRNALGELGTLRGVMGYAVPKFWLEDEGAAHAEAHAKDSHDCGGGHKHDDHSHDDHGHGHGHSHSHSHSHDQSHGHDHHGHDHSHDHSHDHAHSHSHSHSHDHHDHDHAPKSRRILGVIHIIASRVADLEDVRERSYQFLKDRGMDLVIHVEKEGEGRCWCGGGSEYKMN
ncbi:zinc transporter zitb [Stemphylium lycopersici]|uniref:Zinc transporter n=1 Tax=Stemphylium lycopersici TaxID=183478 RepID=A0A364MTH0_STELY|nr:zinc transporter zitb [Stemphylium lycopersici]RAQ99071.1 zinc transporter zitb [Stemphylium lycopersici]RAR03098.1 zinc transporter zitb [Stemphylium lycopersici]